MTRRQLRGLDLLASLGFYSAFAVIATHLMDRETTAAALALLPAIFFVDELCENRDVEDGEELATRVFPARLSGAATLWFAALFLALAVVVWGNPAEGMAHRMVLGGCMSIALLARARVAQEKNAILTTMPQGSRPSRG